MATLYANLDHTLRQIRVLNIYPAKCFEDGVQCDLSTISLQNQGRTPYEALSYVWGREISDQPVYVNGHSCEVTRNLQIALRYLRFEDEVRTIWVDAICINQSDADERTAQVSFIQEIYGAGSKVLVWLGEATDATDEAIKFLRNNEAELRSTRGTELQVLLRPFYKGIHELLKRPWWSRIWVLQEVSAASEDPVVGCGREWFSYDYLRIVIFAYGFDPTIRGTELATDIHLGPDLITEISQLSMNKAQERRGKNVNWNRVLTNTSRREATDPRDKIFAVLGLADDGAQQIITPNYRKSISTVYQEAMALALKTSRLGGDLDLLPFTTSRRDLRLPSWCIDFSIPDWRNSRKIDDIGKASSPYACGRLEYPDLDLDLQTGSISLTGFCIGSPSFTPITASGTQYQDMKPQRELPHAEFMKANPKIMEYFIDGMDIVTRGVEAALRFRLPADEVAQLMTDGAVWETYFAGKAPQSIVDLLDGDDDSEEQSRSVWALLEAYAAKHYWPYLPWTSLSIEIPDEMHNQIREASAAFPFQVGGITFFTTDTGYVGRARDPLQHGDLVCIIYGSQYPVVLRPRGDAFELITFAWVHGAMAGQCVTPEAIAKGRRFRVI